MSRAERVTMVDRGRADLSVRRQCVLQPARIGDWRAPGLTAGWRRRMLKSWR